MAESPPRGQALWDSIPVSLAGAGTACGGQMSQAIADTFS